MPRLTKVEREEARPLLGIDGQISHGDSFYNDRFADLKPDYILAHPPFDASDWRGDLLREDKRAFGVPPTDDTSFVGEWRYRHRHLGARRRTPSDRRSATCYSRSHPLP